MIGNKFITDKLQVKLGIGISVFALVATLAAPSSVLARGGEAEFSDDSHNRSSSYKSDDSNSHTKIDDKGKNRGQHKGGRCNVDGTYSDSGRRGRSSDDSMSSSSTHQNRDRTRTRSSDSMGSKNSSDDSKNRSDKMSGKKNCDKSHSNKTKKDDKKDADKDKYDKRHNDYSYSNR